MYKAVERECRGCKGVTSAAEAIGNAACWFIVAALRSAYLELKCDYLLDGSITRGSKIAEKGHQEALSNAVSAAAKCMAKTAELLQ